MKNIPLRCICSNPIYKTKNNGYLCKSDECPHSDPNNMYLIKNGIPVIISNIISDTAFSEEKSSYIYRSNTSYPFLRNLLLKSRMLFNIESNITKKNCNSFIKELFTLNDKPKVLVIGSGEKGSGSRCLWSHKDIEIHGTDVYATESVDFISDAHYLPLESNYYDGVWIQAVLEHVVDPRLVVNEIHRVLKKDGFVYAETPFMQQVHEGAYDFTRYTVLGHRYLFKNFTSVKIGGNGGADVVLKWSIRYFFWSIFRNNIVGRFFGLLFSIPLIPFRYFISTQSLYDSASGVFFLGRKSNSSITHKDLIKLYKGQYEK